VDPRLRAAVDASRHWYDDVFGLHGIPVRVEDGLWTADGRPPPYHSAAKTLEPGVESARVQSAVDGFEHCAVADSFGDLELASYGFEVVIDATWVHREPLPTPAEELPHGWSVVRDPETLAAWSEVHDYTGVLPAPVLDRDAFHILACRRGGRLVGGAVTHDGGGSLGLSNSWGVGLLTESDEVLTVVSVLHPGRALTDYAHGAELEAMVAAGFTPLGPQRVWLR